MKRFFITVLCLALVFGGLFTFRINQFMQMGEAFANQTPPPMPVETVLPVKQLWQRQIDSVGTLEALRGIEVSAETAGIIKNIHFLAGQNVKKGDLLITLRDSVEQASLRAAKAQLNLAKLKYDRDLKLQKKNSISSSEVDATIAQFKGAKAEVERISELIAQKQIRAPFSGKLGVKKVYPGQYISAGDALVSLQALEDLFVNFSVPEHQLSFIQKDQPFSFTVNAFPSETFQAKVVALNAKVDIETRNIEIQGLFDNTQGTLLPGMFAKVSVPRQDTQHFLVVPQTAVTFSLYGDTVFVAERNEETGMLAVAQRFVEVADRNGDIVAIKSGLKDTDKVITSGQLKLLNGMAVAEKVPTEDSSSEAAEKAAQ